MSAQRDEQPIDTDTRPETSPGDPEGLEEGLVSGGPEVGERPALLPEDRAGSFRDRWEEIQTGFVDEPRSAVERADRLVMELIQHLQTSFTTERESLEAAWDRDGDVSTEDLRIVLQRYRSFFDRLLSA